MINKEQLYTDILHMNFTTRYHQVMSALDTFARTSDEQSKKDAKLIVEAHKMYFRNSTTSRTRL